MGLSFGGGEGRRWGAATLPGVGPVWSGRRADERRTVRVHVADQRRYRGLHRNTAFTQKSARDTDP